MSEAYEGVVFCSNERNARKVFETIDIDSAYSMNLVRLAFGVYGIYRVAGRNDPFEPEILLGIARTVSKKLGKAIALMFDNGSCVRYGALFEKSKRIREFAIEDELWVLLDNKGRALTSRGFCKVTDFEKDEEYERVFSAIHLSLEAIGIALRVSEDALVQAFCYEEESALASFWCDGLPE